MDSTEDASRQVQVNSSNLFEDFCERPFCLRNEWYAWGCCSSAPASDSSTTLDSLKLIDAIGWSLEDEDLDSAFLSDIHVLRMYEAVEPDTKVVHYAIPSNTCLHCFFPMALLSHVHVLTL